MSFLTGQDRTSKFAGQVLPDRIRTYISKQNFIEIHQIETSSRSKKNYWSFISYFLLNFKSFKSSTSGKENVWFSRQSWFWELFVLPDQTWCQVSPKIWGGDNASPWPPGSDSPATNNWAPKLAHSSIWPSFPGLNPESSGDYSSRVQCRIGSW